jgi:hypothetical protein
MLRAFIASVTRLVGRRLGWLSNTVVMSPGGGLNTTAHTVERSATVPTLLSSSCFEIASIRLWTLVTRTKLLLESTHIVRQSIMFLLLMRGGVRASIESFLGMLACLVVRCVSFKEFISWRGVNTQTKLGSHAACWLARHFPVSSVVLFDQLGIHMPT